MNKEELFNILGNLIHHVETEVVRATKYPLYSSVWESQASMEAGLYFVWENSELVYVGESGNTKNRMTNLKNTPNHTLRRKIGVSLGFTLNSNKKFSETEEIQLNQYCHNHCTIAFVPLPVGRRKIEENFIFTCKPKYNQPSARGRLRRK